MILHVRATTISRTVGCRSIQQNVRLIILVNFIVSVSFFDDAARGLMLEGLQETLTDHGLKNGLSN